MAMTTEQLSVVLPADAVAGPLQGYWTYKDYAVLSEDGQRYEIMDGILLMAPSPSPEHQGVSKRLVFYLYQYIDLAGLAQMFHASLDVELASNRVSQMCLYSCNASMRKLTATRVVGAPDLIVEIASPETATYDRVSKSMAYAQAGIQEYWLVYPERHAIEMLILQDGVYRSQGTFRDKRTLPSQVVPGIRGIHVEQFFA